MKPKALVIGLGISGLAAVELLHSLGYRIEAVDQKRPEPDLGPFTFKEESEITSLLDYDKVVVSPGIGPEHRLVQLSYSQEIELTSEAELGLSQIKQKVVGVTGTNGKTTVTLLITHVLKASGIPARALGNVGVPISRYAMSPVLDEVLVVELSSFQLERFHLKVLDAGIFLNLTNDHLDRHGSMESYARAKANMESLCKLDSAFFVQSQVQAMFPRLFSSSAVTFSGQEDSDFSFLRGFERANAEAAWLICSHLGVKKKAFFQALATFQKPAHRLELVSEIEGIKFYDDSKATNVDAVMQAVMSLESPVILLAGGVDKGASYKPWIEAFTGKIKQILLFGQAASCIENEIGLFFNVKIVESLKSAVQLAYEQASRGDVILLSPGCSSFDQFKNFEERGKEFQRLARMIDRRSLIV